MCKVIYTFPIGENMILGVTGVTDAINPLPKRKIGYTLGCNHGETGVTNKVR